MSAIKDPDINFPRQTEVLQKVSDALALVAKGDPLVSLRNELDTRFHAVESRFRSIDAATALVHDDYVRVPTQVDKAVGSLRELMEQTVSATRGVLETRLNAMDKAIELLQKTTDKAPDFVRDQVGQLRNLHAEKFGSISTQLDEKFGSITTGSRDFRRRNTQPTGRRSG